MRCLIVPFTMGIGEKYAKEVSAETSEPDEIVEMGAEAKQGAGASPTFLRPWELLRWRRHRTPAVLRGWATNADWSVASSVSNSLDDPLLDHAPADTPPRVRRELELPATG